MIFNIKIKPNWFMRLLFKQKEANYEILPELTADERALKKELLKQDLISKIKADKADTARSSRG